MKANNFNTTLTLNSHKTNRENFFHSFENFYFNIYYCYNVIVFNDLSKEAVHRYSTDLVKIISYAWFMI